MKKEKKEWLIRVKVWDIKVDEEYYSFKYNITKDGKLQAGGSYDGDYENGMTPKQWKKELEKTAWEIALQQI